MRELKELAEKRMHLTALITSAANFLGREGLFVGVADSYGR
jgi:hypothetical protein